MNKPQSFRPQQRVRKQAEFDRVYAEDAFAADDTLVLRGCRNELPQARLGLSVSRRVGNAVVRNRWKRLIREAFRTQTDLIPTGYDYVARPRKGAKPSANDIKRSLPRLAHKIAQRLKARS